jgi:hypothetical protein
MDASFRPAGQLVEELVEASLTGGRVCGAHGDHLHVEGADPIRPPGLADGVPLQESEEAKALKATEVEAGC